MTQNKTQPTEWKAKDFIATIPHAGKRADAATLNDIFRAVSGFEPVMWGTSIIGYGKYHYRYKSGREGDYLATGFSPRKTNFSVYIMPGYSDFGEILQGIGKHKLGKSCFYFNKLADIDTDGLRRLIRAGLDDLATRWAIHPT